LKEDSVVVSDITVEVATDSSDWATAVLQAKKCDVILGIDVNVSVGESTEISSRTFSPSLLAIVNLPPY
jgi:hypothetical protein